MGLLSCTTDFNGSGDQSGDSETGGSTGASPDSGGGSGADSGFPFGDGGTAAGGSPGAGGNGLPAGGSGSGTGGEAPGAGGFSSDRNDFLLGEDSKCPGQFLVCESFDATNPGELPSGWSLTGYGTRTVGVTTSTSARGAGSLQVDVASQGAVVAMLRLDEVGALAAAHFGRMFYRIEGPGVSEFIHFDVLEAVGPWDGHENGVRFASTGTGVGTGSSNWSWIYNVQPFGTGAGAEFGSEGDRSAHAVVDEWMCLEWEFDSAAQTATYFHDGNAIEYLVIDEERSEIPVLTEIGVGLQKFQSTGAMRVWVDELALDTSRIGCNH